MVLRQKLHAVVIRRPGSLPIPVSLITSSAARHDFPVAKQIMEDHAVLRPGKLYADKAYSDTNWAQSLKQNQALELLTPRKKQKDDHNGVADWVVAAVGHLHIIDESRDRAGFHRGGLGGLDNIRALLAGDGDGIILSQFDFVFPIESNG